VRGFLLLIGFATFLFMIPRATQSGWKTAKNAEKYLPALRAAELKYGLPEDLLARMAYQESRFRDDIVSGTTSSAAGAKGLMQIVPKYHPGVDPLNVAAAIDYAARYLKQLHTQLGSWTLAIAAYNAGPGNVRKYGGIPPFPETQQYVAQISADVPSLS
jgi:soluble lytic murein transglycosylase-like protein